MLRSPGPIGHTALVSPMRTLVLPVPSTADGRSGRARSSTSPPEFYSWENLPPQELVAACMSAFYNCGFARVLCPVPETEATEVFRDIYSIGAAGRGPTSAPPPHPSLPGAANGRNGMRSTSNNFRLCQLLLLAAVGSQYLEETVTDDAHSALFSSGKWYLSVAFGRGANDLQRLRANLLAAVYLIFRKSISVIEHLSEQQSLLFPPFPLLDLSYTRAIPLCPIASASPFPPLATGGGRCGSQVSPRRRPPQTRPEGNKPPPPAVARMKL